MKKLPYEKISYDLFSGLDQRTKDIVMKRFGLEIKEPLTLERIGGDHHITRERVRQIVEDAMKTMKKRIESKQVNPALFRVYDYFLEVLQNEGHLKRQDLFLEKLGSPESFSYIVFLLHLGGQFSKHKETDDIHEFWASKKEVHEKVPKFLKDLLEYFEKKNDIVALEELRGVFEDTGSPSFFSMLEVSKHVVKTHDGKWGLKHWPHAYPRTIRDKAFVVLKHIQRPSHFREVAKLIDELQKKLPSLKAKKILPQTVHNELIKDKKFVLVGRGTYALSDWGFKEGTVKDIISLLLKEEGKPLSKEEIVKKTLEQRKVKETTVLLNLQDRKAFAKDDAGRYYVK